MTRAIAFDIVESEYQVQCRMPPFEFVVCIISRSNNLKHKAPLQRRWPDNPHSIVRHRVQIKRWLRGAGDNYGIIWSAVRGPGALVAETIIIGQQRPLQPYTCLDVKDKWSMLDVGWAWCLHEDGGWGSARWRKGWADKTRLSKPKQSRQDSKTKPSRLNNREDRSRPHMRTLSSGSIQNNNPDLVKAFCQLPQDDILCKYRSSYKSSFIQSQGKWIFCFKFNEIWIYWNMCFIALCKREL